MQDRYVGDVGRGKLRREIVENERDVRFDQLLVARCNHVESRENPIRAVAYRISYRLRCDFLWIA